MKFYFIIIFLLFFFYQLFDSFVKMPFSGWPNPKIEGWCHRNQSAEASNGLPFGSKSFVSFVSLLHSHVLSNLFYLFTIEIIPRKNIRVWCYFISGVSRAGSPDVEPLLTLQNVKILSVREPDPGPWQLSVDSESDYSLRATGRSAVHFLHGFSTVPTSSMAETNHRPLNGELLISYLVTFCVTASSWYLSAP